MIRLRLALLSTVVIAGNAVQCVAGDWITAPSYFTHDPLSGKRVNQYTPIGPFYTYSQPSYVSSGFRNTRSSIQVGTSADHYHTTQRWGAPIQPYGEWRHPYRPYSVPYDAWGPQFYGRVPFGFGRGGFGFGQLPGNGVGAGVTNRALPPGQGGFGFPSNNGPNPRQPGFTERQQLLDGRYPPVDQLGPFDQRQVMDYFYPPQQQDQDAGD